jgi:hypothetical protein
MPRPARGVFSTTVRSSREGDGSSVLRPQSVAAAVSRGSCPKKDAAGSEFVVAEKSNFENKSSARIISASDLSATKRRDTL